MDLLALLAVALLVAVGGWRLLLAYLLSRPHGRRRRR